MWGIWVETVTTWPGVAPSPDSIAVILSGSVANAPTISNSGLCGEKPFGALGYFWLISLPDATLNAFVSLL